MKLFMHELGYPECNKDAGGKKVDVQFWRIEKEVIELLGEYLWSEPYKGV